MPVRAHHVVGRQETGNQWLLKRGVAAAVSILFMVANPGSLAVGQTTGSNMLVVPLRVEAPASIPVLAGTPTPLPIDVTPLDTMPPNAFLRLKGLPQGAALTEGHVVAPGTWAVALKAVPTLHASFPAMPPGRTEIQIQLISVDGAVLAETQSALVFSALPRTNPETVAPPAPPPQKAAPPRDATAPKPPDLSAEERQRAEKLLAQGERFMESGNVAVARQFFQRGADAGLAVAAMKLAATYDPVELERLAVQGVVPQPAEAKRWYERALALGAREARERLARLADTN